MFSFRINDTIFNTLSRSLSLRGLLRVSDSDQWVTASSILWLQNKQIKLRKFDFQTKICMICTKLLLIAKKKEDRWWLNDAPSISIFILFFFFFSFYYFIGSINKRIWIYYYYRYSSFLHSNLLLGTCVVHRATKHSHFNFISMFCLLSSLWYHHSTIQCNMK